MASSEEAITSSTSVLFTPLRMERGAGIFDFLHRLLNINIAPRIGTIVLAVILIGVSAGIIGIIATSEPLKEKLNSDRRGLDRFGKTLQDLTIDSLAAACWLILLGAGVLVGEVVAIILAMFMSPKLFMHVIDATLCIGVAICYCATGIACAIHASDWGDIPAVCAVEGTGCGDRGLTITITLSAVLSFIQTVLFGFIASMIIYTIVKNRKAQSNN